VEDAIETLTRRNPTEVKVVLASVALALAIYQVVLIAVGYGRLRPPFLDAGPASRGHRFSGDSIVAITVVVAVMCVSLFGFEGEELAHVIAASALLAVLAVKIAVVRRGGRMGRYLPVLGVAVLVLFGLTWLTSAGGFLTDS
jgi:hypothetical protein